MKAAHEIEAALRPSTSRSRFLVSPLVLWLLGFFVAPVLILFAYSFMHRGPYGGVELGFSFTSYLRSFDPLYASILWRSFLLALGNALACGLIGFPVAYAIATARASLRTALVFAITLPFLCCFVVRIYALKVALGFSGPLNTFLLHMGWIQEPLVLLHTPGAVALGMILNYLPFFVLPLYATLERFDFQLLEAAKDLGAGRTTELFRVLLPVTKPGITSGFLLVFMPSLGEFLIPDLLGGSRTVFLGGLITEQFLKSRDWPFGAAIASLLLVVVLLGLALRPREEE